MSKHLLTVALSSFVGSFIAISMTSNSAIEASLFSMRGARYEMTTAGGVDCNRHGDSATGEMYGCGSPIQTGVPTFKNRDQLGEILQSQKNMTRGAELGVQLGHFSGVMLRQWTKAEEYLMVDLWSQQENYEDIANVDNAAQENNYQKTMNRTNEWAEKRRVCRNYTSVCVHNELNEHFDFIYVDARHDFKGVYEDLVAWWPKLKRGGIFAGHDYVTQDDGPAQTGQDWTKNYDGTVDKTATVVKGAVDRFAKEVCRQITVGYREEGWNTWAMRK